MSDKLTYTILLVCLTLIVVYGSRILERRWPIAATPHSEFRDDWLAVIVSVGLENLFSPLTTISAVAILNYTRFGWIRLPTEGYWWFFSLAIVVVTLDLYKYGYHRLQHAVPFLWTIHSFHHSANAVTFITGGRHFWLERVLVDAFLPIMAILFLIPPDIGMIASLIFFLPDSCAHLNVRLPMGRFVTWINNPQWHRIHHSALPMHRNKNFASFFPIWDILFGTAWIPDHQEYPGTGLDPAERVDIINSIIWPLRHLRRRSARLIPADHG